MKYKQYLKISSFLSILSAIGSTIANESQNVANISLTAFALTSSFISSIIARIETNQSKIKSDLKLSQDQIDCCEYEKSINNLMEHDSEIKTKFLNIIEEMKKNEDQIATLLASKTTTDTTTHQLYIVQQLSLSCASVIALVSSLLNDTQQGKMIEIASCVFLAIIIYDMQRKIHKEEMNLVIIKSDLEKADNIKETSIITFKTLQSVYLKAGHDTNQLNYNPGYTKIPLSEEYNLDIESQSCINVHYTSAMNPTCFNFSVMG